MTTYEKVLLILTVHVAGWVFVYWLSNAGGVAS